MAESLTMKMRGLAVSSSSSSVNINHNINTHTNANLAQASFPSQSSSSNAIGSIYPQQPKLAGGPGAAAGMVGTKFRPQQGEGGKRDRERERERERERDLTSGSGEDPKRAALMRLAGGIPNTSTAALINNHDRERIPASSTSTSTLLPRAGPINTSPKRQPQPHTTILSSQSSQNVHVSHHPHGTAAVRMMSSKSVMSMGMGGGEVGGAGGGVGGKVKAIRTSREGGVAPTAIAGNRTSTLQQHQQQQQHLRERERERERDRAHDRDPLDSLAHPAPPPPRERERLQPLSQATAVRGSGSASVMVVEAARGDGSGSGSGSGSGDGQGGEGERRRRSGQEGGGEGGVVATRLPNRAFSLIDFELGRPLGRGKFGRVYLARDKGSGYVVALKCLMKSEIVKDRVEKQVMREIEIQQNLRHPNVLALHTWFNDKKRIVLALEYAQKGELFKHLQREGRFEDKKSSRYIAQMTDALSYLHSKHVIHRDIKPENLLLDQHGNLKIADFGWSVHAPSNRRHTYCGTLDYLPPEIVMGKAYGHPVDLWALGVLTYEFLCGSPPFEEDSPTGTQKRICSADFSIPQHFTSLAANVIKRLLVLNPPDRLPLKDVLAHPWITQYAKVTRSSGTAEGKRES